MPVIFSVGSLRFRIYVADHPPPHVHVTKGGDCEARIDLQTMEILTSYGFGRAGLRDVMKVVREHKDALLSAWKKYHE